MTTETVTPEQTEDDGLARPISFEAQYAAGQKRTLALGGGGLYFVAWQVGYLSGLAKRGVHVRDAETIVGTSAGSVVASVLCADGLRRFSAQANLLSKFPALVHLLAPAANFTPSQQRALDLFRFATENSPETIKKIGFAALAAHTPSAAEMRRNNKVAIIARGWPSKALHITATDVYTAERLVITGDAYITAVRAASASSAVPGIFAPQPIHDRFAMDGGVSGSGAHLDVVAGSERALVLSLRAYVTQAEAGMTIALGNLESELAQLAAVGTEAIARGPRTVQLDELMSPAAVPKALAMADEQAEEDAPALAKFWAR